MLKAPIFKILAVFTAFFIAPALAQNPGTVTANAFAVGKGAGVQGFASVLCTQAQIAIGQNAAAPICAALSGDITMTAGGVTAIGANKVTDAMLRQSGALALIGRSANSTGNVGDILASAASGCVFRESSNTIGCGTIATAGIANNAVTNAKAAQMAAYTLKGNATGSTADPTDVSIPALTQKVTPVSADKVMIADSAASNQLKYVLVSSLATASGVSSLNTLTGGLTFTVSKQVFTASGTYTPSAGTLYAMIECVGGGGGGGGVAGAASFFLGAGGGAAGSYARVLATAATIGASQTVTIGAAGAGGTAGANAGSTGGNTSVGTICTANGGTGGGGTSSAAATVSGGTGGAAGTGDLATGGAAGIAGIYISGGTSAVAGGTGGSSVFGSGGRAPMAAGSATAGSAALGFGSGGGGASANNSASNVAGGAGTAGVVFITEYRIQ